MCNGINATDCIFAIVDTCTCISKAIVDTCIYICKARPGQEGQVTSSGQEGKVEEASIMQTGHVPTSHTMQ